METKPLYYESIDLLEFEANVVDVRKENDVYHVVLDQSAFYPNSGGMLGDYGYIDDIKVIDTLKIKDEIVHVLEKEPTNKKIKGIVDKDRRFNNIQIHDSQHLLTAILEKDYQLMTVSHHNLETYADLVLEGPELNDDIIKEIERYANELIINKTKMDIFYLSKSELSKYNIKDNPKYSDPVRITNIEGLDDYNACGCLHFDNLSNIQAIKIFGYEKVKNQYRIIFTCGLVMLDYLGSLYDIFSELKVLSKSNEDSIVEAITSVYEKNKSQAQQINEVKTKYYQLLVNDLYKQENDIKVFYEEDLIQEDIKIFASVISSYDKEMVALLQVKTKDNYSFILVKPRNYDYDLKGLFEKLKEEHQVQGGGSLFSINGQSKINLIEIINK